MIAYYWAFGPRLYKGLPGAFLETYTLDGKGRTPVKGDVFKNLALAKTLRLIGEIEADKPCSVPEMDAIVERAASMKVPILQHTWLKIGGNEPGESTPYDVVAIARRHPDVQFVCVHTGGDWERGIRIIRDMKNVSAEIAGSNPTAGFVEMAVRELGAERVIYGSDVGGRSFASQLGKVLGAEIPESAKELILGGNLRRLLTPVLRAKGYRV